MILGVTSSKEVPAITHSSTGEKPHTHSLGNKVYTDRQVLVPVRPQHFGGGRARIAKEGCTVEHRLTVSG